MALLPDRSSSGVLGVASRTALSETDAVMASDGAIEIRPSIPGCLLSKGRVGVVSELGDMDGRAGALSDGRADLRGRCCSHGLIKLRTGRGWRMAEEVLADDELPGKGRDELYRVAIPEVRVARLRAEEWSGCLPTSSIREAGDAGRGGRNREGGGDGEEATRRRWRRLRQSPPIRGVGREAASPGARAGVAWSGLVLSCDRRPHTRTRRTHEVSMPCHALSASPPPSPIDTRRRGRGCRAASHAPPPLPLPPRRRLPRTRTRQRHPAFPAVASRTLSRCNLGRKSRQTPARTGSRARAAAPPRHCCVVFLLAAPSLLPPPTTLCWWSSWRAPQFAAPLSHLHPPPAHRPPTCAQSHHRPDPLRLRGQHDACVAHSLDRVDSTTYTIPCLCIVIRGNLAPRWTRPSRSA